MQAEQACDDDDDGQDDDDDDDDHIAIVGVRKGLPSAFWSKSGAGLTS